MFLILLCFWFLGFGRARVRNFDRGRVWGVNRGRCLLYSCCSHVFCLLAVFVGSEILRTFEASKHLLVRGVLGMTWCWGILARELFLGFLFILLVPVPVGCLRLAFDAVLLLCYWKRGFLLMLIETGLSKDYLTSLRMLDIRSSLWADW